MSSLALRGGSALLRAGASHPYYRFASAGLTAYKYGKAASPYLKMGYRAYKRGRGRSSYRSNKRRVRRRVGEPIGKSTAKWDEDTTNVLSDTRQLYYEPLLNLAKGSDLNDRERDVVNFRGIKFCMSLINEIPSVTSANGEKTYFNYAVISPKASDDKVTVNTTGFFRGHATGGGTGRGLDFGTGLTALEFRCLPINTDKWNVHMHKRIQLAPFSSVEGLNTRTLDWYMPLKRQIRYDGTATTPIGKQMFFVWWSDMQGVAALAPSLTNAVDVQLRVLKYFREPRN